MKIGLMWFDNSKLSLPEKVGKAVVYYQDKYGRQPTMVMVNPKDYQEVEGIKVQSSRSILPNNLWLGVE